MGPVKILLKEKATKNSAPYYSECVEKINTLVPLEFSFPFLDCDTLISMQYPSFFLNLQANEEKHEDKEAQQNISFLKTFRC